MAATKSCSPLGLVCPVERCSRSVIASLSRRTFHEVPIFPAWSLQRYVYFRARSVPARRPRCKIGISKTRQSEVQHHKHLQHRWKQGPQYAHARASAYLPEAPSETSTRRFSSPPSYACPHVHLGVPVPSLFPSSLRHGDPSTPDAKRLPEFSH